MPPRTVHRTPPLTTHPIAATFGQFVERQPKWLVITLGFAVIGVLATIDYWLTYLQIHFLVFYLIPILFLTWFAGWNSGLIAALLCSAINFTIDYSLASTFPNPAELYVSGLAGCLVYLFAARAVSAVRTLVDQEQELARTDYTTGAANRRAFFEALDVEIYRARRHRHPLSVVSVDLDNFKTVNDLFGHRVGDVLLSVAVRTMQSSTRATDTVARLGGDEFGLLLPEAGPEAAQLVTQRVQNGLLESMRSNGWPVTFSIGIATFLDPPHSADELLKKADELMYAAKHAGKDALRQQVY